MIPVSSTKKCRVPVDGDIGSAFQPKPVSGAWRVKLELCGVNLYPLFVPMASTGSIRFAACGQAEPFNPSSFSVLANPIFGQAVEYVISAVVMERKRPTAEASFAAILDLSKFGIAIAAMIKKKGIRENCM